MSWLSVVIENNGTECGNCGEWRILKLEDGILRIIEECVQCHDEAYDIFEAEDEGP